MRAGSPTALINRLQVMGRKWEMKTCFGALGQSDKGAVIARAGGGGGQRQRQGPITTPHSMDGWNKTQPSQGPAHDQRRPGQESGASACEAPGWRCFLGWPGICCLVDPEIHAALMPSPPRLSEASSELRALQPPPAWH